ncbi:MAG: hypothetical protein WB852_07320 [Thermoplasmata archaeon]
MTLGPPGFMPSGSIFISSTDQVFTAVLPDLILVTSSATNATIASLNVGPLDLYGPTLPSLWAYDVVPLAFDNATGDVLVLSSANNTVIAINTSSDRVATVVNLSAIPGAIAYDPFNAEVFVLAQYLNGSAVILILNGSTAAYSTNRVVWTGTGPFDFGSAAIVVDTDDQDLYFTDFPAELLTDYYGSVYWLSLHSFRTYSDNACAGGWPMAYDATTDEIYLPQGGAECFPVWVGLAPIVVISGATHNETAAIGGGALSWAGTSLAYDSGNQEIVAASSQEFSIVSPINHSVVRTFSDLVKCPAGIAVDPLNEELYLPDQCSDDLVEASVVNGSSGSHVIAGLEPSALAYDPSSSLLAIADQSTGNVTLLSTLNDSIRGTMTAIPGADALCYNSVSENEYVAGIDGSAAVLIGGRFTPLAGLSWDMSSLLNPPSLVCDPTNGATYLGLTDSSGYGNVSIFSPNSTVVTTTVPGLFSGLGPSLLSYDPTNHSVLAASWSSDAIVEINDTFNEVSSAQILPSEADGVSALDVDSANGRLFVSAYTENVSGLMAVYSAANGSLTSSAIEPSPVSALGYDAPLHAMFGALFDNDSVIVFNGTTSNSSMTISVGAEPVAIAVDNQTGSVFVANYASDSVTIISHVLRFPVSFTEQGLPNGAQWFLNVTGQPPISERGATSVFGLANGTYDYSIATLDKQYEPLPADGVFTVTGSNLSESVLFSLVNYSVTLIETGLPSRTNWSVTLNGTTEESGESEIMFAEPNGSYSFSVGTLVWYEANPNSGLLDVSGRSVNESITFSPSICYGYCGKYPVEFTETGLPSGTTWSVTINGSIVSAAGSMMILLENGTYPFTVGEIAGYSANPQTGQVTVNGGGVTKEITFSPTTTYKSPGSGLTFLGLSDVDWYVLVGVIAAVAMIGIVVAVVRHRRGKAPPDVGTLPRTPGTGNP